MEYKNAMNDRQLLENALSTCKIDVNAEALERLMQYHELLTEKNKVMNLTAITDFEEAVWKHYADSLVLMRYMDLTAPLKVLDLGSGAGLPGIPLKICNPNLNMTLLDAVRKKVDFHHEVFNELGLKEINSIHMRSEDAAHKNEMREAFDLVTARAVANMSTLSEYCLPFVKTGGLFAAYKAETADEELSAAEKAITILGGKIEQVERYTIGDNSRCLILIRKVKKTPSKYPRKAGTPSKAPLS